jgi:hypothetical protein
MYHPIEHERYFAVGTLYSDIEWDDFRKVVDAFRRQLEYWYILPTLELKKDGHFGFAIAASACLLGDCLSQYEAGRTSSHRDVFQDFFRRHFPDLAQQFPRPIATSGQPVQDAASALYFGLRCGVLHEAHPILYVGLEGQDTISEYHASGLARYTGGGDCPVVTFDPGRLLDGVHARLDNYTVELTTASQNYNQLRANFQRSLNILS